MNARDLLGMNENVDGTLLDDEMMGALQNKWRELLDPQWDAWKKRTMSQIFENEVKHLKRVERRFLGEATGSTASPDVVKFVFPVIRRVWPNTIANSLFSVQPMNSPVGGIFYWEYKYATTKGLISANMNMVQNFDMNYSSEYVQGEVLADTVPGAAFADTLAWKPVIPCGLGQVGVEFIGVTAGGVTKRIYDADGTGTLTGDGTGTCTLSSGVYSITFDDTVVSAVANYFYDMEATAANIPQINVGITLSAVKARSRKLKMLWSAEAADDMRAVLNMDIEPELTSGVANEIMFGLDRELLMAAYGCGTTNTATFDAAVPPGRNQVDHFRNITTVVEKVSGAINTATNRGPGNFIVTGPDVQPIFAALKTHGDLANIFQDNAIPTGQGITGRQAFPLPQVSTGYGVYTLGWLQSKWCVIVDPKFPAGKILVGLKGTMFADSGIVYAPYVPLDITQAFADPGDFSIRKGVRTRYAKKVVNPDFYGVITVTNLP